MEIVTQSLGAEEEEIRAIRRSLAQWYVAIQQSRLPGDVFTESVPEPVDNFLESTVFNPCLQIRMDGGSAKVDGPLIPVIPEQAYRLNGKVACDLKDPFEIKISILWLDASGEEIGEVSTDSIARTCNWQMLSLPNLANIPRDARFAKIRLQVSPKSKNSLFGTIRFDSISMDRIPRIDLQMIPKSRIVQEGETVTLQCKLDALDNQSNHIGLRVVDHNGIVAWKSNLKSASKNASKTALDDSSKKSRNIPETVEWKVPLNQAGFYRFHVETTEGSPIRLTKSTTAVAYSANQQAKLSSVANHKLGWSLPTTAVDLAVDDLPGLISFANVGRIKISIWLVLSNSPTKRSIDWLIETLSTRNIDCSGVITSEPQWRRVGKATQVKPRDLDLLVSSESKSNDAKRSNKAPSPSKRPIVSDSKTETIERLATILEDPQTLDTIFQPLWTRASLLLVNYQVGWDDDLSLAHNGTWKEVLQKLELQVRKFAPESQLIVPWAIIDLPPTKERSSLNPNNRLMLSSTPPLTGAEITQLIDNGSSKKLAGNWISLDPIDSSKYSIDDRVRDLVQRMIAVHASGLETGWISNPCSDRIGILDSQGGPEDLLLPLRMLSHTLTGAYDFISFHTDSPFIENAAFRSNKSDHMILWAYESKWINAQWGDQWTAVDIWGRPVPIRLDETSSIKAKQIEVGRWPIIVTNINRDIIKWQMEVTVENQIIENRVGQSDPILVAISNPSNKLVKGNIKIHAPDLIQGGIAEKKFSAIPNAQTVVDVPITLRRDVARSSEQVEIVVELDTTPPSRFSTRKPVSLGLKNFQLETKTRLDDRGRLVVELEMINSSGQQSSFDCTLHIPNKPRERIQVINLGERSTRSIVLPDASSYRGQSLLIRCEEIGTGRILNQRINVPE